MGILRLLFLFLMVMVVSGCKDDQQLARLEKENQELKAKVQGHEYDLAARCSKDARAWFDLTYPPDPNYKGWQMEFTNHHRAQSSQCFASVNLFPPGGVQKGEKGEQLWDVHENRLVANILFEQRPGGETTVIACKLNETKCTSEDQFDAFVKQYMVN
jgi:hypothetical protein